MAEVVEEKVLIRGGTYAEWVAANPILASRELGVITDTGGLVVGNDSSYFPGLLNYFDGKFKNILTVAKSGWANYKCSDAAYGGSDTACIQTAINFAISNGIPTLMIMGPGPYTITNYLTVNSDLKIIGVNNPVFNWAVNDIDMIQCMGTSKGIVTGSADIAIGNNTVTVSSAANVNPGDLILIYDNTVWNPNETDDVKYTTWKTGELHEVMSISGNTITFSDGLLHNYSVSKNLSVEIISPIKVDISGLTIIGADETAQHRFIRLDSCKHSSVHDCVLDKGSEHGIVVYDSYDTNVYNNKITRARNTGNGYGIAVHNSSAHTLIHENNISSCRHCVASGGDFTIGQPRDIRIYNNELFRTILHCVDAHQIVESIYVYNNTIRGDGGAYFAFSSGAKYTEFKNNTLYDCCGATIRGCTPDMIYVVENNTSFRGRYMFYDNNGYTNTEKFVSVCNNRMFGADSYLVFATKAAKVKIADNYIDGTLEYSGIYLQGAKGEIANNQIENTNRCGILLIDCSYMRLADNELINCCQAGGNSESNEAGISLQGTSSKIIIDNNRISDANGKMRYGIREYDTANYNIIKNNVTEGFTVGGISTIGANTTSANNL